MDGALVDRHIGDWPHSRTQGRIISVLSCKYPNVQTLPSLTTRTRETRYRVPDVCVVLANPRTRYLLEAPFLIIEVVSEEDRLSSFIEKLREYSAMSTPHIWVVDPRLYEMFTFRSGDLLEVKGDVIATENPRLELTRAEVFKDMD